VGIIWALHSTFVTHCGSIMRRLLGRDVSWALRWNSQSIAGCIGLGDGCLQEFSRNQSSFNWDGWNAARLSVVVRSVVETHFRHWSTWTLVVIPGAIGVVAIGRCGAKTLAQLSVPDDLCHWSKLHSAPRLS